MSAKRLPPGRPPGSIDLLGAAAERPSESSWRADALGRSRHSRLADEVRAPIHDPDPARAELVCARITRAALGDFAPALLLLSRPRRRRAQALAAWTVTLFDLARRPGLAGLDGDRLAQINAWEFQTEEALDGNPPGQPVFVMMARAHAIVPWPRTALDRIVLAARKLAVAPAGAELLDELASAALLEALFAGSAEAAGALATLLPAAAGSAGACPESLEGTGLESLEGTCPESLEDTCPESLEGSDSSATARGVDISSAPRGWRRALSYVKRRMARPPGTLGLAARLRLLAAAAIRPR